MAAVGFDTRYTDILSQYFYVKCSLSVSLIVIFMASAALNYWPPRIVPAELIDIGFELILITGLGIQRSDCEQLKFNVNC
jgi:hypothetical protein